VKLTTLFAVMAALAQICSAATNTRPNILWLIAEDFGPHLSCYGVKEVSTPNIDQLARDGIRFDRFYTTAPVCSASRSAFMTGMYQTTIGAHNHRSHRDDGYKLPDGVRVLTDWFRDGGYFTANVREFPEPIKFRGTGKTDWNFTYQGKSFDSDKWNDLKSHQPFYAQINFQETHRAFHAPKRADSAKVEIPRYYPDHDITRKDMAAYLDSATELDRKIGVVLKRLEADGLADNTIVVFFGDNGEANVRGKQFCYEEGLRVPLMIRWPKGIPAPKNFKPGTINTQLIEAIDLAPTMLDFAGLAKPAKMQGRIFGGDHAEAPRQYAFGARDRCDETVFRFRTVREARYRYIRNFTPERPFLQPNQYKEKQYPVWSLIKDLAAENKLSPIQAALAAPTMPEEELYDLQTDPHEIKNLAHSPQHAEVLKRLRVALEKWISDTDDKGRVLEPEKLVRNKGLLNTNSNPNTGYTLDGKPPGAADMRPAKR
jgi:N-sulfoglucosamine sulfohydrolase